MYREKVEEVQGLRGRYGKEGEMNERMVRAGGRVYGEKERVRKELERGERELAVVRGSLGAKNRFIGVLERKVAGGKGKGKEGGRGLGGMKSQGKFEIADTIEEISNMKRMKSFDKIVREKNSVLLRPNKKA